MKNMFRHASLSKQFLLMSFAVLLAGSLVIGWWIGKQVKESAVQRVGSITALYVDAFVGSHVQSLRANSELTTGEIALLNSDIRNTKLGERIVSLKIWSKTGQVAFSTDTSVIGKQFQIGKGLAAALSGNIYSAVSERSRAEQAEHGQPLPRMIETYTPIREDRTGSVIAAAEFYERPDELDRLAGAAQFNSWIRVAGVLLLTYLCLFALVRRGSRVIEEQQNELGDKVVQLIELNTHNVQLQERVINAAQHAASLNEKFLQRISADIHDGPGQDLGFALMQIKNMEDGLFENATPGGSAPPDWTNALQQARAAIESALKDLRAMSANIELPDIAKLCLSDIAERVVRDFQVKTGETVELDSPNLEVPASFRVKVALYRVLQESLANTFRHARRAPCQVKLRATPAALVFEISDQGPGFDPLAVTAKKRLGLVGMRQRIEVLGGSFELVTAPNAGTTIRVSIPLKETEDDDGKQS